MSDPVQGVGIWCACTIREWPAPQIRSKGVFVVRLARLPGVECRWYALGSALRFILICFRCKNRRVLNSRGWCPLRLKRVFLVATGVLAALFLLEACSSDSGSSAGAISVDGLWSIYEPELNPDGTPTGYSLALAYNAGSRNKPQNDRALKTQFLQLTSSLQFQQAY